MFKPATAGYFTRAPTLSGAVFFVGERDRRCPWARSAGFLLRRSASRRSLFHPIDEPARDLHLGMGLLGPSLRLLQLRSGLRQFIESGERLLRGVFGLLLLAV
ncbi:hypothetical protein R75465_08328 [Paraburkholderia aspalathi]|nr:hypothetical protein R75465_08328 [Paraburkholderia aspalathi]